MKIVKKADKDVGDQRKLKLHGSGYKREYFVATERAAMLTQQVVRKNRRPR